jgi:hypothetical protein
MLPGERGAGAAATGNGAFRAPPGTRPQRVKALEAPGRRDSSRPASAPGIHRAGIFALFLLPGGRPRHFTPELDLAAEEAEGSIAWGR